MQTLLRAELLILDEIAYLPLERPDATCRFELVNKRSQQQKSIILTSNKSFGANRWDEIFPDTALATALLDQLLHRASTITIRGESYRLRHRRNAGLPTPSSLNAGGAPAATLRVHFQTAVDTAQYHLCQWPVLYKAPSAL